MQANEEDIYIRPLKIKNEDLLIKEETQGQEPILKVKHFNVSFRLKVTFKIYMTTLRLINHAGSTLKLGMDMTTRLNLKMTVMIY